MTDVPDTLFVVGLANSRNLASQIYVTPTGGFQRTLADALAETGGGSLALKATGVTSNTLLGTLPASAWLLRLLLRDRNRVGGSVGLGTTSNGTDILSFQTIAASGTFSLTVPIDSFSGGSFEVGVTPSVYLTLSGVGMSLTVQLDYELGP